MEFYTDHAELYRLVREQQGCKLYRFELVIDFGSFRRKLSIFASNISYARKMANLQLEPGTSIASIRCTGEVLEPLK